MWSIRQGNLLFEMSYLAGVELIGAIYKFPGGPSCSVPN
jgi:hypothetical protein